MVYNTVAGPLVYRELGALIKEPLNSHKQNNDVVLTGITGTLEEAAYKLQVLPDARR